MSSEERKINRDRFEELYIATKDKRRQRRENAQYHRDDQGRARMLRSQQSKAYRIAANQG